MNNSNSLEIIAQGLKELYQTVQQINSFLSRPETKASVKAFFDNLKNFPDKTKQFLGDLAYRGWFFTDEMTLNEIAVFYSIPTFQHSPDESQIDSYMETLVEKYLEHIKECLYERFPARKAILGSAFKAHDEGEYDLSIPVFLAQADGIGSTLLNGISPFSRKTSKGTATLLTREEINKHSALVDTTLIEPLGEPIAMTAKSSSPERLQHPHLYNRHEVLHGISIDYGNKTNSLKAISLLGYLATVLYDIVQEANAVTPT